MTCRNLPAIDLVVVDSSVEDYESLVCGLSTEAKLLILRSNEDGIAQITQWLAQHQTVSSLHVISHGKPGCLYLGNAALGLDTFEQYRPQLEQWSETLSPDASVLLYGCRVAAGNAGDKFLEKFYQAVQRPVAASANLTGNAALGGDWQLERTIGEADWTQAISEESKAAFINVLEFAPVNTVPGNQTINSGDTLTFSSTNGNLIAVDDPDTPDNSIFYTVTFQLTQGQGTLIVNQPSGLSVFNNNTSTVTMVGSVEEINQALDGAVFSSSSTYVGVAKFQLSSSEFSDGQTDSTFEVDVTAVNLPPTSLTLSNQAVDENAVGAVVGTLTVEDPTPGDSHTYAVDDTRFEIVNDQLKLKAGVGLNRETDGDVTVEVTVTDRGGAGSSYQQSFTVAVNNVNEAPVITAVDVAGEIIEGAMLSDSGSLSFSDVDADDTATVSESLSAVTWSGGTLSNAQQSALESAFSITPASFSTSSGTVNWSYDIAEGALDFLKAGETVSLTYTVTVMDADGLSDTQDVAVEITGANDSATISGNAAGSVVEDSVLIASGTLTVSDIDRDEDAFQPVDAATGGNGYGTFSIDEAGEWSYSLNNNAVQNLPENSQVIDTFTFTSQDGTDTQLVTITITGTNDSATISGASTGSVVEDGTLVANGQLTVSDTDDGESTFQAVTSAMGNNGYGTFSINTAGSWTYNLDNASVQNLPEGEQVSDTYTFLTTDSTAQVVSIAIVGTNDVPTIGGTSTGNVTEDGTLVTSGTLTVTDIDTDESAFQAVTDAASDNGFGTFSIDAAGNWSYELDNSAVQGLVAGAQTSDSYSFLTADGTAQMVSVTITGANDTPLVVLNAATVNYLENGTPVVLDSSVTITDADNASFNGGSLTVAFTTGGSPSDRLSISEVGGITIDGSVVAYNGDRIGTYTGGFGTPEDTIDGLQDLVITFDTEDATQTAVQALAQSISYSNASNALGDSLRTVEFIVNDGTADGSSNFESEGLKAEYYNNSDFSGYRFVRPEATVDFDWAFGSPDASIGADTFSARWTGQIEPRYTEDYTFYTLSDDGVRLWVNDQLIIDNWTLHARTTDIGTISLAAGQKYNIRMEYFEDGQYAAAKLEWQSASQPREVVPQSQLSFSETAITVNVTDINDAPILSRAIDLYTFNRTQRETPDTYTGNGGTRWLSFGEIGSGATQATTNTATRLDTVSSPTASIAGYSNYSGNGTLVNSEFPVLDASQGYTLSFTARVRAERHRDGNAQKNSDGVADRAGFSVLLVSSDPTKAIELGFWKDRIFAQEDGSAQDDPSTEPDDNPPTTRNAQLFTQAEAASFDTASALVKYDVTIKDNNYTLFADGIAVLSGELRDYTAFSGPVDPYDMPNSIFLGDNTPSASTRVDISAVSITTDFSSDPVLYTENDPATLLLTEPLDIADVDDTNLVSATVQITGNYQQNADVLALDTLPSGITGASFDTNSGTLTITGSGTVAQFEAALQAVTYENTSDNPDGGDRTVTITVNDGKAQSNSIAQTIQVTPVNDAPVIFPSADLDGFVIDNNQNGLWHLSEGRGTQVGHTGLHSLYYGKDETIEGGGNYNSGNTSGQITSAPFDLTAATAATLSFNYILQTESSSYYDAASVLISQDGGSTFNQLISTTSGSFSRTSNWTNQTIDLSAYIGDTVQLRFAFDTVDGALNRFEGWYIDDVTITTPQSVFIADFSSDTTALKITASEDDGLFSVDLLKNAFDPEGQTLSVSNIVLSGNAGGVTTNGNTLDVSSDFYTNLAVGESETFFVSYNINDTEGGTTPQTAEITITGANDAPQIEAQNTTVSSTVIELTDTDGSAENTANLSTNGNILFSDVDLSDTHVVNFQPQSTDYLGTFDAQMFFDSNSSNPGDPGFIRWTFTVNDSLLDSLSATDTLTQTYTVTIDDQQGGTATQDVTITIQGTNDVPVITVVDAAGDISENNVLSESGSLTFADVDQNDTVAVTSALQSAVWSAGTLTPQQESTLTNAFSINSTTPGNSGTITWDYTTTEANLDFLAAGETVTLTYELTVDDQQGGTATENVTITITGANDLPQIESGSNVIGGVTEIADGLSGENNTLQQESGAIFFSDVDFTDTHTVSVQATPAEYLGSFNVALPSDSTNGQTGIVSWSFQVEDSALDGLANGQTITQTYTLEISDSVGTPITQDVTITLTGTEDRTVITFADNAGEISELPDGDPNENNDTLRDNGFIQFTDADLTDAHSISGITSAAQGYVGTFNASILTDNQGNTSPGFLLWTFEVNDAELEFLAEGETSLQTYTLSIDNGNGDVVTQAVTVTLTGTNDSPAISVDTAAGDLATAQITETNAGLIASDTLTLLDPDVSDVVTASVTNVAVTGVNTALPDASTVESFFSIETPVDTDTTTGGQFTWTFDSGTEAFDYLAVGESVTLNYTIEAVDPQNETATQVVSVTITGTNDAPQIDVSNTTATAAITELTDTDGANENTADLSANGSIAFSDLDLSDSHTISFQAQGNDYLGTFTPQLAMATNSNGASSTGAVSWNFTVNDSVLDSLGAGETLTQVYQVTIDDQQGGTATQDVTITITGTNDLPVIETVDTTGTITELVDNSLSPAEGSLLSTSGSITFSDVDVVDNHTITVTPDANNATSLGALVVTPAGIASGETKSFGWTFEVSDADIDYLAVGEALTQNYTVTVDDGQGGTDSTVVAITLTGSNDAPEISVETGDLSGAVLSETNAALTTTGTLTLFDADVTDVVTTNVTDVVASGNTANVPDNAALLNFLSLSNPVDSNTTTGGSLTWTFDSSVGSGSAFDYLPAGESLTLTYTITADDDNGGSDTQEITITVNGTNDAPVAENDPDGTIDDIEPNNELATAQNIDSADWSLAFNSNIGDSSVNTSTSIPHITINGTGDATYDYYSFTVANAGDRAIFDIDFGSGNGSGSVDIYLRLFDSNGTLVASDDDSSTNDGQAGSTSSLDSFLDHTFATPGTYIIKVSRWSDNALPIGSDYQLHISLENHSLGASTSFTTDEETTFTTSDVTTNDSDIDDGDTFTIVEIDGNAVAVGNATLLPSGASLTLNNDNTFDYDPNGQFEYLAAGETATDTFEYTIEDSQGATDTATVTIAINGVNDEPVFDTDTESGDVSELTDNASGENVDTLTATGNIAFSDVDVSDSHTITFAASPNNESNLGTFALNTSEINSGETKLIDWTFSVNDADIDYLAEGETLVQEYIVTVDDGNGGTDDKVVTITLTGTEDSTVITTADDVGEISELPDGDPSENNSTLSDNGSILFTDADLADTHSVSNIAPADQDYIGTFDASIFTDNQGETTPGELRWTFSVEDAELEFLAEGEMLSQTYTIAIDNDNGDVVTQDVTVTLTGTNDAPAISVDAAAGDLATAQLTETDAGLTASDTLTLLDPDVLDVVTASVTNVAATGVDTGLPDVSVLESFFTISTEVDTDTTTGGQFTWTFDSGTEAFNYLAVGESVTLDYTIEAVDPQNETATQVVSVTITGTNDAPQIEAQSTTATGTITELTDADGANENTADLNASGSIAFSDLDLSDSHVVSFEAQGNDYLGTFTPQLTTAANSNGSSSLGSVSWAFTVNDSALDSLSDGEILTQVYQVTIDDQQGGTATQDVTITIAGTNDAPVIETADAAGTITELVDNSTNPAEGSLLSTTGSITFSDVDIVDSHIITVEPDASNATSLGTLVVTPAGIASGETKSFGWTFEVSDADIDYLAEGEILTQNYTVTVDDGNGGTANQIVTISLVGTNDLPVIEFEADDFDIQGTITELTGSDPGENTATLSNSGAIAFSDVDIADAHTASFTLKDFQSTNSHYSDAVGAFSLDSISDTSPVNSLVPWRFEVNDLVLRGLGEGDRLTQVYTVTVDDAQGGTATQDVTLIMNGTNDAPDAKDDNISVDANFKVVGNVFQDLGNGVDADIDLGGSFSVKDLNGRASGVNNTTTLSSGARVTINANGDFTYDPSGVFDNLGASQSASDRFKYTIVDAFGETDTATVNVTINGTNAVTFGTSNTDLITGTDNDDIIVGLEGSDVLTGRGGRDLFVYRSYGDRMDQIQDFEVGVDRIDLHEIFDSLPSTYSSADAVDRFSEYVRLVSQGSHTEVRIDLAGNSGDVFRPLLTIENVEKSELSARDFVV